MMFSRSIHLRANLKVSLFFFHCVVLHCVSVPHLLYLFFSQGAFSCFQVLAMTNNASMNIVEHMDSLMKDWRVMDTLLLT